MGGKVCIESDVHSNILNNGQPSKESHVHSKCDVENKVGILLLEEIELTSVIILHSRFHIASRDLAERS